MANTWGGAREGAGRRPDFHRADERERHGASHHRPAGEPTSCAVAPLDAHSDTS